MALQPTLATAVFGLRCWLDNDRLLCSRCPSFYGAERTKSIASGALDAMLLVKGAFDQGDRRSWGKFATQKAKFKFFKALS